MTQSRWIARIGAAAALALPLAACVPPETGNVVAAGQAQVAQRATLGTIVGGQPVVVQGGNPAAEFAGVVGGGVAGGLIGNEIGQGRGRDLARIAGATAGAAAGQRAASAATRVQSFEWVVRLDTGQTVSVIQASPTFTAGQRVRVVQSPTGVTRLVAA